MESFTKEEIITLHNTNFFAVKAAATKKIDRLLTEVRDEIKNEIQTRKLAFPPGVDAANGKIFRGENYLGLPYLVLDYPKHFSREFVFAFRTMFWWGNFFSFTLHLQGRALEEKRKALTERLTLLRNKDIYICLNNNPWQYHYEKDNYVLLDQLTDQELREFISKKEFLKLSRKIPIEKYKDLKKFCQESFNLLT